MAKLKLCASFRPRALAFDDGITEFFAILTELKALAPFQIGWEAEGHDLMSDPEGMRAEQYSMQEGSEGFDGGYYFAVAESARFSNGQSVQIEQSIAMLGFQREEGRFEFDVSILPELASVDLFYSIIEILKTRYPLQYVAVEEPFYAGYDTPLDVRRQPGFGWAGWVPFALTPEDVPEAGVLSRLAEGTFLAPQATNWDTTDQDAVKRAQALELRLDALGLLPSRRALSKGDWGLGQ